jgi:regulator of sigma D
MQHYYSEFFTQYCRFISKDLLATFDKRLGRNTKMIYAFYKVFFAINKKGAPKTTIAEALSLLSTQVDNYLSDGDTSIYSEMNTNLDCANKLYVKSLSYLGHLMSPLNDFNEAISDFNKLHEQELFKQGLIEFNNALAHLFVGFCTSETNFEKNISKACTHLHRGSLDYYKTLIKNKESLTYKQKKELINIRNLEMKSIGLEVTNSDKDNILIEYRNLARQLHNIQPTVS